MSENKNIENFDSFFKEAFDKFEPDAPQGVWEGIQSQIGAQGASATGATTLAKTAQWGLGKIILGTVATVAVATTVYFAVNTTNPGTTATGTPAAHEKTAQQPLAAAEDRTAAETPETISQPADAPAVDNTPAESNTTTANSNNAQIIPRVNNLESIVIPGTGNTNNATGPGSSNTPNANRPGAENTQKTTVTVPLYVSDSKACVKDNVVFTVADDISKTTYRFDFGDGTSYTTKVGQPIVHAYKKPGNYKVSAAEVNGNKITGEFWINIVQVKAAFTTENTDKATFKFTSSSEGALYHTWFFGDGSEASKETSPMHTYRNFEEKEYRVKLVAMNEIGCVDSFTTKVKQVYTYDDMKPIVPNVFSPNGDGYNDRFEIGITNEEKYHLIVYDRRSNKVFESTSKETTWDGKNIYSGDECAAGTYMMIFVYKIKGFDEQKVQETITIRR